MRIAIPTMSSLSKPTCTEVSVGIFLKILLSSSTDPPFSERYKKKSLLTSYITSVATMRGKDSQGSPPQTDPDLSSLNLGSGPVKRPSPDPLPSPPPPPRRPIERRVSDSPSEPEDDDNPFGDSNVIETPVVERGQPRW